MKDPTILLARARVISDTSEVASYIPVLVSESGVIEPVMDYMLSRVHDRSISWMLKVCRSIKLFLEYVAASSGVVRPEDIFKNFVSRLYTGTFDLEIGLDRSNLCWAPRSPAAAGGVVVNVSDFLDWLSTYLGKEVYSLNPRYNGGKYDNLIFEAAYRHRRESAFLGHVWEQKNKEVGRLIRPERSVKVSEYSPPAFPDERFLELIFKGFNVRGRMDYRNSLITLLLHGAGFRESEPFHLYVDDVMPSPLDGRYALVKIHHPSHGEAPQSYLLRKKTSGKKINRTFYLNCEYGLNPRTKLLDVRRAGWKGGMHDGPFYKVAHWFTPEYGEIFLDLWWKYLEQISCVERKHPFAFINLARDPIGGMYSISQYRKAHSAACERIGLKVSKGNGTTPHGHRHAYGLRLSRAGVEREYIRRFMHHSCLESQEVYTQPSMDDLVKVLRSAVENLSSSVRGRYERNEEERGQEIE